MLHLVSVTILTKGMPATSLRVLVSAKSNDAAQVVYDVWCMVGCLTCCMLLVVVLLFYVHDMNQFRLQY
jgi:hypothetical protein